MGISRRSVRAGELPDKCLHSNQTLSEQTTSLHVPAQQLLVKPFQQTTSLRVPAQQLQSFQAQRPKRTQTKHASGLGLGLQGEGAGSGWWPPLVEAGNNLSPSAKKSLYSLVQNPISFYARKANLRKFACAGTFTWAMGFGVRFCFLNPFTTALPFWAQISTSKRSISTQITPVLCAH